MDCNEVLEQLADYLDENARAELCRTIEQHLSHCHDCQIQVDTLKKTIVLYQHERPVDLPVRISQTLEAMMAKEYRRASGGSE